MKYWDIKAKDDGKTGELMLYSEIANAECWGDEVTPAKIDAELKALGDIDKLVVRINSPGGSVFAGQAIHAIISRHPAKEKIACVDGLAASIASVIPLACDKIVMSKGGTFMIHKPFGAASGTSDALRARADIIDKLEDTLVSMYAAKTKMDEAEIRDMLKKETWMNATEAKSMGFVDEIEGEIQIAASIKADLLCYGDAYIKIKNEEVLEKLKAQSDTYRVEDSKPTEPVVNKDEVLKEQQDMFTKLKMKLLGGIV